MSFIFMLFIYVIPLIIAYFLIYFAVKNAIVDAKRELAATQAPSTYNALRD